MVCYQEQPLIICPKRFLERRQFFVHAMGLIPTKKAQFFIGSEVAREHLNYAEVRFLPDLVAVRANGHSPLHPTPYTLHPAPKNKSFYKYELTHKKLSALNRGNEPKSFLQWLRAV
jgi:hypothetical protein